MIKTSIIIFLSLSVFLNSLWSQSGVPLSERFSDRIGRDIQFFSLERFPHYLDHISSFNSDEIPQTKRGQIISEHSIQEASFSHEVQDQNWFQDLGGKPGLSLYWSPDIRWIEWEVDVPEDGFYEIWLSYFMRGGSGSPAQRSVMINGEYLFEDAQFLMFRRQWTEEGPVRVNRVGDQVNPRQIEVSTWQTVPIQDGNGFYPEPLKFFFHSGMNTIRINFLTDNMFVSDISLRIPDVTPHYSEVLRWYNDKGLEIVSGQFIHQAEDTTRKTDPTLRRMAINDPAVVPFQLGFRKLNAIGHWAWRNGGQSITWELDVPESGLYSIAFKNGQWWGEGLPVFRTIKINGQVPFREMYSFRFPFNREYQNTVLADDAGEPFLFYLKEGSNELTMTVTVGPIRQLVEDLQFDSLLLAELIRKITLITGPQPDLNFDFRLDQRIPNLLEDFDYLRRSMYQQETLLVSLGERRPVVANNFTVVYNLMTELIEKPEDIPRKLTEIENAQRNLGSWIRDLQAGPLLLDFIVLGDPQVPLPRPTSTWWQRLWASIVNFFMSFFKDYDSVGGTWSEEESAEKSIINVWVTRGMDWGELMKEIADESFTPETNIGVNINVLPANQLTAGAVNALLLAILSGNAPDVASGTDFRSPVEFAIRGASADLSQFPDFQEVTERFLPGVMIPFEFDGGVFALPETNDFTVLFYRNDIFTELNLPVPNTWEELYRIVLPVLRTNGMEMFYPRTANGFLPLLFQNNGEFYREDNTLSGLDTPEAFRAFRQWTQKFTNFRLPVQADFYNRFRTGTMPIGVGNYFTYVLISTAAPELRGRWSIAPIPGTVNELGQLDRAAGGEPQSVIMIEQSTQKDESWEFMKWWTSRDVQAQFGRELEALMGVEARWNTSNLEAFRSLAWDPDHLSAIEEQWNHFREQPYVLGGYFTIRHVDNAWNRVVLGTMGVRDSLERAVRDINRELQVKREEFEIINAQQRLGEE